MWQNEAGDPAKGWMTKREQKSLPCFYSNQDVEKSMAITRPPGLIVKQQPVRGQWTAGRGGSMEKEGSMTMKGSAEGKKSVVDDG